VTGEDPLLDLWTGLRRALGPFGVPVERDALELWREQWARGSGPFWAAERGDTGAIDAVIAALRELRGDGRG